MDFETIKNVAIALGPASVGTYLLRGKGALWAIVGGIAIGMLVDSFVTRAVSAT